MARVPEGCSGRRSWASSHLSPQGASPDQRKTRVDSRVPTCCASKLLAEGEVLDQQLAAIAQGRAESRQEGQEEAKQRAGEAGPGPNRLWFQRGRSFGQAQRRRPLRRHDDLDRCLGRVVASRGFSVRLGTRGYPPKRGAPCSPEHHLFAGMNRVQISCDDAMVAGPQRFRAVEPAPEPSAGLGYGRRSLPLGRTCLLGPSLSRTSRRESTAGHRFRRRRGRATPE